MTIDNARVQRAARSAALAALADGQASLSESLLQPPTPLLRVDLWVVLLACPKLGRAGARQVCERANVWPHLKLISLSPAQRQSVVDALPPRARSSP
jgi:hypothetical protein